MPFRRRPVQVLVPSSRPPRSSARVGGAVLALGAVLAVGGCGGNQFGAEPPPAPPSSMLPSTVQTGPLQITIQNDKDLAKRPFLIVKGADLPTQLETKDIITGNGREAQKTDTVTVQYVGVIARNSQEFDASWDKGEPATFPLDQVIPGFRDGIAGMKEGGRRQIIMPPDQAYGAEGAGSTIGPNETLIFIVDLIKIA
jgi:peptidylprolyl isomerase